MASPRGDGRYGVDVSAFVVDQAHEQFGESRSGVGVGSEYDFVAGPLLAARLAFEGFSDLPEAAGAAVRAAVVIDPLFGAVSFTAVLVAADRVEIADFVVDPGYWSAIDDDPDP